MFSIVKKFCSLCIGVALTLAPLTSLAANTIETVDSLLQAYTKAHPSEKGQLARQLIDFCLGDDQLTGALLTPDQLNPADGAATDLIVNFAAERFYYSNSYFAESLHHIDQALPLADDAAPALQAFLLCDRSYCLFKQGQLSQAATAGEAAMQFCLAHNQTLQLARAYLYLAIVNYGIPQIDEAIHFVEKAMATDKNLGTNVNSHNILGIACEIYSYAGQTDRAVECGQQAVEAAKAIGCPSCVVNHMSQLSYAYNRQGDYQRGLAVAQQAVAEVEKMEVPDRNLLAISLEYVAYNLLDMKRNAEAVPVLLRAIDLEREVGNTRSVCYDYKSLAEAYEPDDPRQAITALRKYIAMADSLHSSAMAEALSKADADFHNEELRVQNSENRRLIRIIIIVSIITALLLLAVIVAMVYIVRLRGKNNRRLQKLQAIREAFFTNVTHELRTPITVIQGMARQIKAHSPAPLADGQEGNTPADAHTAATLIEGQSNRLLELVNQVLDLARVTNAVGNAHWEHIDVMPLFSMVEESFLTLSDQRHVQLAFHHQEQHYVMDIVADYLLKILYNLLSNALKNTPEGGSITVGTSTNGQRLVVSVSDNGTGIAPEDLKKIFEPFYKGKLGQQHGTGIGLTLTQQLVRAHHGTISVSSVPEQETTFTFTLPMKQQGVKIETAPTRQLSPLPVPSSLQPDSSLETIIDSQRDDESQTDTDEVPVVLIVEDNKEVAYYISQLLYPYYTIHHAANGQEGMEKARSLVPDIIITDIMMPIADGLELCRQVRADELTCHIPIIVITALVTDEERLRGLEAGATAYLNKPFSADELLTRVRKLLEQQKMIQRKYSLTPATTVLQAEKEAISSPNNDSKYSSLLGRGTGDESPQSSLNAQFLSRLQQLVAENMADNATDTEHLASLMHLSQTQLRRKIAMVTGISAAKYILMLRIEEAKRLLAQFPEVTIIDTAYRTGFSDNAHFTHVFRRITDMTPLQYIKSLSGNAKE